MIIQTGMKTDIPAFYSKWLWNGSEALCRRRRACQIWCGLLRKAGLTDRFDWSFNIESHNNGNREK